MLLHIEAKKSFALEFLARMEVDKQWPWNILWTDEDYFYLMGDVNTLNCRIWGKQIPHVIYPVPCILLKSLLDVIWQFHNWTIFLWKVTDSWTCYMHCDCSSLEKMSRHFVIPELQQHGILDTMNFMQDGAPLHTDTMSHNYLSNITWMNGLQTKTSHFLTTLVTRPQQLWLLGNGVISKALIMVII